MRYDENTKAGAVAVGARHRDNYNSNGRHGRISGRLGIEYLETLRNGCVRPTSMPVKRRGADVSPRGR